MTLREFFALLERHRLEMRRQAHNTATICAQLFNAQRTKQTQKVWTAEDFLGKDKDSKPRTEMDPSLANFKKLSGFRPKKTKHG